MAEVLTMADDDEIVPAPGRGAGRWLMRAALMLVALTGGQLLLEYTAVNDLFPVHTVRFGGDLEHVADAELRAAVSPHINGGLLSLDVGAVRAAVEARPWVAEARIRRVWPDALTVEVVEQTPVARWGDDGLLNAEGVVFRPDARPTALPLLAGPQGSATEVLAMFRRIRDALATRDLAVTGLTLDARRAWTARLAGGGELAFGHSRIPERLERLVAAWPAIRERRTSGPEYIDLRYPNGLSVRWAQASTAEE